ncbi:MAG: ATP-binding protein [Desulfobacterales bacterium]
MGEKMQGIWDQAQKEVRYDEKENSGGGRRALSYSIGLTSSKPDYRVSISKDGEDTLRKAASPNPPDLILLEIIMPGMSGYEAPNQAEEKTSDIPVIFISSLGEVTDIVKGFSIGGVDYIPKPFRSEEVLARVRTHLALRDMQARLEAQNIRLVHEIGEREKAQADLRKANEELEMRVAQRTAQLADANKELEKAKEAAESASRAKTDFLSRISHELRTPLSPIVGMTDLLLMSENLEARQREFLQTVRDSGAHLSELIDGLIELTQLEAEDAEPVSQSFSLEMLLESVAENLEFEAESKGLEVTYHTDEKIPDSLTGDPDRVEKILMKLGGNAVKFTEKGAIDISAVPAEKEENRIIVQFSVKDTGIGIPSEKLAHLFEDFTQADGSSTREYGGMGLGLTLVKRMVTLMQGRLWAESRQGEGSIFHFTLPFVYQ